MEISLKWFSVTHVMNDSFVSASLSLFVTIFTNIIAVNLNRAPTVPVADVNFNVEILHHMVYNITVESSMIPNSILPGMSTIMVQNSSLAEIERAILGQNFCQSGFSVPLF